MYLYSFVMNQIAAFNENPQIDLSKCQYRTVPGNDISILFSLRFKSSYFIKNLRDKAYHKIGLTWADVQFNLQLLPLCRSPQQASVRFMSYLQFEATGDDKILLYGSVTSKLSKLFFR